ncbi:hemolysin III family protein [Radiobacillus kanasensis]|uniref:PAQR family membrane homeostasis protein TrhA n=1 Tax=Radiobacillus kanasensis TaxID=2844358 RepID=UPI001E5FED8D|nr:hemolysin III family protein [Radiobacillus kanasensis]UFU00870.1 hemolysin III family protein [Radiobacillus kanasensis]
MRILKMTTHTFTKKEEIAHAITHGIGAVLSIVALILLIIYASLEGSAWQIVSATVFGSTMLIMYLSSTIVHSLPDGKWKNIFQIFDHSSIYLFIAGTYTPFLLGPLRGEIGWTLFGIVWGIAVIGVVFKVFFVNKFLVLSTVFYILMGWMITLVWGPLTEQLPSEGITYLVLGGMFYTVGAVFYVWRKFHFHHAVWHLFVLAGSMFHFLAVFYYII